MNVRDKIPRRATQLLLLVGLLMAPMHARADQEILTDGVSGDGHMVIRGDQYGAFGDFSVSDKGYGNYDPDGPVGLKLWAYWSGMMLTDGVQWQWLMDANDWPGDFGARMLDDEVISDESTSSTRTSSFNVSLFGDLRVDLVQELSKYNILQTYTFNNQGNSALELKALWETDVDMEFAQTWQDNLAGFVLDDKPRVYIIEESDVPGEGDPGVGDRDRRISVIGQAGENASLEGAMAFRTPMGSGGATHLHYYAQRMNGVEEDYLNGVWEIIGQGNGQPNFTIDDNGDNLMDDPGDCGAAMQFALNVPAHGSAKLTLNFVGGSLSNAAIGGSTTPGDFNNDKVLDTADIDLLTEASGAGSTDLKYDVNDDNKVDGADVNYWVKDLKKTWVGDADVNMEFNSADFVQAFIAGKYETEQKAVWSEGDWNGSGKFDSSDFVDAFVDGGYEKGPAATSAVPEPSSVVLVLLGILGLLDRSRRRVS